jgi:hypothetical protein
MLHEKALLVNLSISRWGAQKTDKKVTKEVTRSHGATDDSGDFRKSLVDKTHLKALTASSSALRAFNYKLTLPWDDDGRRILPSKAFAAYTDGYRELRLADEKLVRDFISLYPNLVATARNRLGSLYDPADFPDPKTIKDKFGLKLSMENIPNADDFRVNVGDEAAAMIREQITAENDAKFQSAMKHCYERVQKMVSHISTTLHQEDPRIFDSLVNNALDLVDCLPMLNLADDPLLEDLRTDLKAMLPHPDALRTSEHTRAKTADAADAIIAKMAAYGRVV